MEECTVQPVVHWKAEVVLVQLNQCIDEFRAEVEVLGKVVSLKFKLSTDDGHDKVETLLKKLTVSRDITNTY